MRSAIRGDGTAVSRQALTRAGTFRRHVLRRNVRRLTAIADPRIDQGSIPNRTAWGLDNET